MQDALVILDALPDVVNHGPLPLLKRQLRLLSRSRWLPVDVTKLELLQQRLLQVNFILKGLLMNLEMNLRLFKELKEVVVAEAVEEVIRQHLYGRSEGLAAVDLVGVRDQLLHVEGL